MKKYNYLGLFLFLLFIFSAPNDMFSKGTKKNTNKRNLHKLTANPQSSVMNINNITSWVDDQGFHNWVVGGGSWNGAFPNGANLGAIFSEGIVWGGKVTDGQTPEVRVNGNTYSSGTFAITRLFRVRPDYQNGDLTSDAASYLQKDLSSVTNDDITGIRNQYAIDWNEWPAEEGAAYDDVDGDGAYDPNVDIPGIPGASQTIFIKYDDSNSENIYGSPPIGFEVSETYWGYALTGALSNVIYKKVEFVYTGTSKSSRDARIDSMYIVQWSDPDVGNSTDDYAGCDTTLNLGYAYSKGLVDADYAGLGFTPAVGFDFLQGVSQFTGNPNDSAMYNLNWRKGYKYVNEKPMSSFVYFAAGGAWSDPSFDYNGTLEFFNLMRGKLPDPPYPSAEPFPEGVADVTATGIFLLAGDPVAGTGKIDGNVEGASDRRIMVTNGPITMVIGDTAQVVIALVGGMGATNLSAVTQLKSNDFAAQLVFDNLFQLPSIDPPSVDLINLHNKVVFNWSNPRNIDNIESYDNQRYLFEGYEIYQLPTASASLGEGVKLGVFDLVNGVTKVYDEVTDANGTKIPTQVADGSDSGIQRYFTANTDAITRTPLRDGQEYYFAVIAYAYSNDPVLPFHILRSPKVTITAVPQTTQLGERYGGNDGDVSIAEHTAGVSNGSVVTNIIDPSSLTGDTYEVSFNSFDTLITSNNDTLNNVIAWTLTDKNTSEVKLEKQINQNADAASPIVDGVQFKVSTEPINKFKNFLVVANASGVLSAPNGGALNAQEFPSPNIDDNQQVGDAQWAIHTSEDRNATPLPVERTTFTDFLGNILLNDDSIHVFPYDWEMRFTEEGSWAVRMSDGAVFKVPFELWNTGVNTPDDPSDDYRLIPWISDTDNDGTFNLSSVNHSSVADTSDWTDVVTWRIPVDSSAGTAGYDAFISAIDTVGKVFQDYLFLGNYALENTVLIRINTISNPTQSLPEIGTIFRINTTKWNKPVDKYVITIPKGTFSNATAKEDAGKINVFPNPYYGYNNRELSREDHYVTFNHLPKAKVTIRIFDLAGVLVRTINHLATNGQFERWNLQNNDGFPVASGIYIVYIEMPNIGVNKILKVAIVQEQQILKVY